jgi:2-polyprenyl-3-methyl-5-hydroxy-6-metoxy-1,4-benzoquinol methylase
MHVSYAKAQGGYTVEFSEDDGRRTRRHVALNGARAYPDLPDQNSNAEYYEAIARILGGATAPFKVLDGACGSGYGSEILVCVSPREFQHDIFGIDTDPDVVEYASLRHRRANFLCADAAKMGFREGFFDMIVDVDGLPHMEDPAAALRNYHRMLCDVGLLFIAVPKPDRDAVMKLVFASGFEVAHELCDNDDLLFLGCVRHKPVDNLAAFWEQSADEVARHHCDGLDDWADFVDTKFGDYISDAGAGSILEWGCGKGDISRRLAARVSEVHLVDILDESLQRATGALKADGLAPASTTRVEVLDQVALPVEHVDALLCTAVVQHFPTVAYWREVAAMWRALTPDTIVLQTRHADETRETRNYRTEYFTALWLSTEEVVSQFPEYEVVFHHVDTKDDHLWSAITHYEFFVLKRRS